MWEVGGRSEGKAEQSKAEKPKSFTCKCKYSPKVVAHSLGHVRKNSPLADGLLSGSGETGSTPDFYTNAACSHME